ncbi:TPA: hypothetical protein L8N52_004879 [Klebsiella pneumoniae]|nr:hypothetical protein [Klebsiella pneumoniae]HBQ6534780.1 hypothetical protein [Klebsiella pneumoniae]
MSNYLFCNWHGTYFHGSFINNNSAFTAFCNHQSAAYWDNEGKCIKHLIPQNVGGYARLPLNKDDNIEDVFSDSKFILCFEGDLLNDYLDCNEVLGLYLSGKINAVQKIYRTR